MGLECESAQKHNWNAEISASLCFQGWEKKKGKLPVKYSYPCEDHLFGKERVKMISHMSVCECATTDITSSEKHTHCLDGWSRGSASPPAEEAADVVGEDRRGGNARRG